jgi:hypothetical protein
MSDYRYDTYQHYGTNAERLAFTPSPPGLSGVQPIYIWFETDTATTWLYHTAWVQIGGSGSSPILVASVVLDDTDIKALPSGDFTLIAAPAAGLRIVPLLFDLELDTAAGAYTNVDDGSSGICQVGGVNVSSYLPDNTGPSGSRLKDALTAVQISQATLLPYVIADIVAGWGLVPLVRDVAAMVAAALVLHVDNNGAGDFTGGNAANTLTINIPYLVL